MTTWMFDQRLKTLRAALPHWFLQLRYHLFLQRRYHLHNRQPQCQQRQQQQKWRQRPDADQHYPLRRHDHLSPKDQLSGFHSKGLAVHGQMPRQTKMMQQTQPKMWQCVQLQRQPRVVLTVPQLQIQPKLWQLVQLQPQAQMLLTALDHGHGLVQLAQGLALSQG